MPENWSTLLRYLLTHWGRVTHICVDKLTRIGSDNGLLPGRRRAIIWTNAGILLIEPLGTNFSEILIRIRTFSFKEMHLKMWLVKWRPFCLGLNVLIVAWWFHQWNCVNIGAGNGLSPSQHQAINWTNAELLSTGPLGANIHFHRTSGSIL